MPSSLVVVQVYYTGRRKSRNTAEGEKRITIAMFRESFFCRGAEWPSLPRYQREMHRLLPFALMSRRSNDITLVVIGAGRVLQLGVVAAFDNVIVFRDGFRREPCPCRPEVFSFFIPSTAFALVPQLPRFRNSDQPLGHIAGTPPPSPLRSMPSFLSWEEFTQH